jgi:uncharacterized protein (TIGR02145 family)
MKKTICFFTLLFSLQICVYPQSSEKRLALIIGNSAYEYGGALKNPVNDANLMASTLSQLGFDVIKKTDADLKTMQMAEVDFKSRISQYKVALFYYAGHGIQVDGINFLIPVDAKLDNKEYTRYEAFDISNINKAFMANRENVNIMILDACRNDPFKNWERGGERGFKKIENSSTGTIIAFATQPGETAADGSGVNGLYTSELVKQLVKPLLIEQVFKKTRKEVNRISVGKQVPQEWSSLMDDFYFTKIDVELNTNDLAENTIENNNAMLDLPTVLYDQRDGKTYKITEIGNQVWMAENLNYKPSRASWCYDDDNSNCDKYGRLYDWETAKKVCPSGWHLPTDEEWKTLEVFHGMNQSTANEMRYRGSDEGEKIKSTSGWNNSRNGTDPYGFSALPGGHRGYDGSFNVLGGRATFWSATGLDRDASFAWYRSLGNFSEVERDYDYKSDGYSVRCLKDF